MASRWYQLPIRIVDNEPWFALTFLGDAHRVVCFDYTIKQKYSFAGDHRVRLLTLKGNVHLKVPTATVSIEGVPPAQAPAARRQMR